MITDNRTTNFSFKKPNADNDLADDVGRIEEAFDSIDTALKATNDVVAGKQASLGFTPENAANKGAVDGYAGLDGTGKVPASQLPSYVDDVLEFANFAALPGTGESGKIYVLATPYTSGGVTSSQFRWSGSAYAPIIASPGSTDAVTEGATNLYHTAARVIAAALTGISFVTGTAVVATDTVLVAFGKLQQQVSSVATAAMTLTNKTISFANNTFTGAQNYSWDTVASAATTSDIWGASGNLIGFTGSATVTAFPNAPQAGAERVLICSGSPSFTASGSLLIDGVASAATVACVANDQIIVRAITTTTFRLTRVKYDGTAQVAAPGGVTSVNGLSGAITGIAILELAQNVKSVNYTTVLSDSGKHLLHPTADTTARTFTIPSNAAVPYPIGTAITFVNQAGAGVLTISITTDTMRLAGAGTTGNRSLAVNGIATAVKLTATEWIISGTALG